MGKGAIAVLVMGMAFLITTILAGVSMASVEVPAASGMLQFRAGGHLLGFAPDRAYLVAMDHSLNVEFLGARGGMPEAENGAQSTIKGRSGNHLEKVVYENLWDGISLTYEATRQGITESTYHVAPGADVSKIRLKYNVPVELQKSGSLRFRFDSGYATESAPVAWQKIDGRRVKVDVTFSVRRGEVGVKVGEYDVKYPLIIDPTYAWHSFYGSSSYDAGNCIVADNSGNVYVAGYSWHSWNGPSGQLPIHNHSGDGNTSDIFVIKLDSNGNYQWHTFYGSTGLDDSGIGIMCDGSNSIYVTGYTGGTWNGPANQLPLHDTGRLFVLKLDTGGSYQWHTFYGANNNDYGWSVKVDSIGFVYILGQSSASWNGPGDASPLNPYGSGTYNSFVLKLSSNGTYQWHTFYGSGSSISTNFGFAVDGSGNSYITGESGATWNGPGSRAPLHAFSGLTDIFVLKLDSVGDYEWHTFYGSSDGYDFGQGIGFDNSGNVYVLGHSRASWDGPGGQPPLNAYAGTPKTTYDIFVMKLDSGGAYQWHTFYGSGSSYGDGGGLGSIIVDGAGNSYIAGFSPASWGSPLHPYSGGSDILILKLNSNGTKQWHTFYGSTVEDYGYGIAMDTGGDLYIAGYSNASWQGDNNSNPIHAYSGAYDAYVLKLSPALCSSSPVMISETGAPYLSISDAYNAALGGQSILAQAAVMPDSLLNFGADKSIKLQGGYYECDFSINTGYTTVHGKMTISGGPVTVEKIIITN